MTDITNEAKQYIAAGKKSEPYYTLTPEQARTTRVSAKSIQTELPELASTENRQILARDGWEITVRIYTPKGEGPFPIIVYYHGGGWVFGDLESAHAGCHLLAHETSSIVISVDYRLAPLENP